MTEISYLDIATAGSTEYLVGELDGDNLLIFRINMTAALSSNGASIPSEIHMYSDSYSYEAWGFHMTNYSYVSMIVSSNIGRI